MTTTTTGATTAVFTQEESTQEARPAVVWNYKNIVWFVAVHVMAGLAFFYTTPGAVAVAVVLYYVTGCFGITMGYHRLFSHRSFQASRWLERTLAVCGTLAFQGDIREWVARHRMHHADTDTEKDPHNSHRGFWFSHLGWLCQTVEEFDSTDKHKAYARDIDRDPFLMMISSKKAMILMQVALAAVLFAVGGLPFVFWGVFVRMAVVYHSTWLVNSATHKWGYRNFETKEESRNNWFVAIVSFGEGWHNNHHHSPSICRAGRKWWEVDLTYGLIKILEATGAARKLKKPEETAV